MVRRRHPHLQPTLVVNVENKRSVDDKGGEEDANSALTLAVDVNYKGAERRDGALGREMGRGGSALLLSMDPSSSPFDFKLKSGIF